MNCRIEASPKGIADSDEPLLRFCLMVFRNLDRSANARSENVAPAQNVWSSKILTMPELRRDSVQGCQFYVVNEDFELRHVVNCHVLYCANLEDDGFGRAGL